MDLFYTLGFIIIGTSFFLVYRQGINDGMRMNRKEEKLPPLYSAPKRQKKKTEKEVREEIIRTNIENYTGTAEGQVKVR